MNSTAQNLASGTAFLAELRERIGTVLVGQEQLLDGMLIGLLTGGHILIEGLPGLAKTLAVKLLAQAVGGSFARLQFTPDMLPSDIVGSTVYRPEDQSFAVKIGPLAANIVLADEINRAPAKTQSALLEAMQEHQVTIGSETIAMPEPFLVIATQNPLEQAGTYPLPEAQKDRFLLRLKLSYPSRAEERQILTRMGCTSPVHSVQPVTSPAQILSARALLDAVHVSPVLHEYLLDLIIATRPGESRHLSANQQGLSFSAEEHLETGASPRAAVALLLAGKAMALLHGRDYLLPEDLQAVLPWVLAHRLVLNFTAEAAGLTAEDLCAQLLRAVRTP